MKLSTRSRYGTRLLLEVALSGDNRVSLGELTSKNQISRSYAERLIAPLVTGGIITSYRGFGGGICLGRPASQIKLSEVVRLLEGDNLVVECISRPETCTRSGSCVMRNIWRRVEGAIFSTLDSITIQELADKLNAGDNQTSRPVSDGRPPGTTVVGVPAHPVSDGAKTLGQLEHAKLDDPVNNALKIIIKEQEKTEQRIIYLEQELETKSFSGKAV